MLRPLIPDISGKNMGIRVTTVVYLFLIVLLRSCCWSQEMTGFQIEQKRLMDKLMENYDPRVRPSGTNGTDGPVEVKVNVFLRDVTSVSDYDMDFGVQVTLRQEWMDERLKYDDTGYSKYLTVTNPARFWTPDLFISNEKDGHLHKLMAPNTYFRIHPSGRVLYSARLSLTLWCHMQMQRFPFDSQLCTIRMASFGYTTEDVVFDWKDSDPLQVSKTINILGFALDRLLTSCCNAKTNTGQYSCLKLDISLSRDLQYYMLHSFLPSATLVAISWTVFWLEPGAVVARTMVVLGVLLMLSSLSSDLEASVPNVPYVKAMDLWMAVCFMFLLAALLEIVVVNANSSRLAEPKRDGVTTADVNSVVCDAGGPGKADKLDSQSTLARVYQRLRSRLPTDPSCIDSYARLLFPCGFIFFVVFYLIFYCLLTDSPRLN